MNGNRNEFEKRLNEARKTYEKLDDAAYAPVYNSQKMLQTIQEYYQSGNKNINIIQIDEINVGLLAAKALDFDDEFTDYADTLHNVWDSFLSFLKAPYINFFSGPEQDAYDFYLSQNYSHQKAINHMRGIDFTRPVNTNFTLNTRDQVAQWKNKKLRAQSNYYSEIGSQPSCLGIYYKQEDKQGNINVRVEHKFSLLSNVTCLKSYAADVLDTWSIKNQSFPVRGGCIQYFNMVDKKKFQPCP